MLRQKAVAVMHVVAVLGAGELVMHGDDSVKGLVVIAVGRLSLLAVRLVDDLHRIEKLHLGVGFRLG